MKLLRIIGLLLLLSFQVKADIIDIPHTDQSAAVSLEATAGVEKPFTKHNSVNFWTGIGLTSLVNEISDPGYKIEAGVEIKHYFSASIYNGFNLGLYSGFVYLNAPVYSGFYLDVDRKDLLGFVPGLKLSYLKRVSTSLQLEPYIGVSIPWYSGEIENLFKEYGPGFMLTLGFRASLNSLLY